jgi:hypothetical protein
MHHQTVFLYPDGSCRLQDGYVSDAGRWTLRGSTLTVALPKAPTQTFTVVEIRDAGEKAKSALIIGKWQSLDPARTISIFPDGTCSLQTDSLRDTGQWILHGGTLTLTPSHAPAETFSIVRIDRATGDAKSAAPSARATRLIMTPAGSTTPHEWTRIESSLFEASLFEAAQYTRMLLKVAGGTMAREWTKVNDH